MKKKIIIIVAVALVAAGGAYKTVLAKPAKAAKPKVEGAVYVLPKEFLVNLADGRFAKLQVALVLDREAAGRRGRPRRAATPPEGYRNRAAGGRHPRPDHRRPDRRQPSPTWSSREGREQIKEEILKDDQEAHRCSRSRTSCSPT